MKRLPVTIEAFVDSSQPGWVRASFCDITGKQWSIVEKVPVLTEKQLDEHSHYPQPTSILCLVVNTYMHEEKEVAIVDTSEPWGISAEDGTGIFHIYANQLTNPIS